MAYTVKAVADAAGVSVRALHYYDQIGLLKPASVSASGYRLYSEADLERLQEVLFFRELGFSLQEIKAIIDSPSYDRREALVTHRRILLEKQDRLARLIRSVDRTINAIQRGIPMGKDAMFEGFDKSKIEEYRKEARERWGSVVDESYRRVSHYTKEDWDAFRAESEEITTALASLMDRDPADPEVQKWIGRHYNQIKDHFYTPTAEVYRGLGDLYVEDSRFTENYDKVKPGLAKFMRSAMHVYADRMDGDNR
ncbi:MAG: MerR family transcriptional regulator [Chloroflexota bacterium]|jgi:DNA-binding transcriptional MerR regulator